MFLLQSGKTLIANFLSESVNIEEVDVTRPTQGVRIVEFELSNLVVNGKSHNVDIELWDCSGDHRQVSVMLFFVEFCQYSILHYQFV